MSSPFVINKAEVIEETVIEEGLDEDDGKDDEHLDDGSGNDDNLIGLETSTCDREVESKSQDDVDASPECSNEEGTETARQGPRNGRSISEVSSNRSSFVEKDISPSELAPFLSHAVLENISSSSVPRYVRSLSGSDASAATSAPSASSANCLPPSPSTTTSPVSTTAPSRIPLPSPSSPAASFTFPSPLNSPHPVASAALRRRPRSDCTRRPNRSNTITMKDRFVTELCLFDPPSGPNKEACIHLGVFVSTDCVFGMHTICRVSPVSCLSGFKLEPQYKILKINDLRVEGWSHSHVIEFVRGLSLASVDKMSKPEDPVIVPFSIEYLRNNRRIASPRETPVNVRSSASLLLHSHRVRSVREVSSVDVTVQHRSTADQRIRLHGDFPYFIKFVPSTVSPGTLVATVGYDDGDDKTVCLKLHSYNVTPSEGSGEVVVIENKDGGGFMYANGTGISVMNSPGENAAAITRYDSRFFRFFTTQEDPRVRIQNIATGKFLSAKFNALSLVVHSADAPFPNEMLFDVFPCNHG